MDAPNSILKISRAQHHKDALEKSIKSFLNTKRYTLGFNPNPKPPKYVITARRDWLVPAEWSLMVGDFAHNARSCLDMLVYLLSRLDPADRLRTKLQFPICDTTDEFAEARVGKKQLEGVSPSDRTIIESFQPYCQRGPLDEPISLLRDINNTDKHRLIQLVTVIQKVDSVSLGAGRFGRNFVAGGGAAIQLGSGANITGGGGFSFTSLPNVQITDKETIIAEIESPEPFNMDVYPNISTHIDFGIGSIPVRSRPVLGTLALILYRVKEIVGKFDPAV